MTRKNRTTEHLLLAAVLVFAPLAWGAVETWSLAVVEIACFTALALALRRDDGAEGGASLYAVPGLLPLGLLLGYLLLQIVPLPTAVVGLISPETEAVYRKTVGIGSPLGWISFSLNRKATLVEFFRLAACAACYLLTVQLLSEKKALRRALDGVAIFASLLASLAILQHLLPGYFWFAFRELPDLPHPPFGPYLNRNHYAGLMEMLFPVVFALFLYTRPEAGDDPFWRRVAGVMSRRATATHVMLGFSSILIAASIILSLSRGGMISLSLAMAVFGLLLIVRSRGGKGGLIALVTVALVVFYVGWFGWEPIFHRFGQIFDAEGNITLLRPRIWEDVLAIAKDFPGVGTGFGTLVEIYPRYRTIPGADVLVHAHSDYLQMLAEGGAVGLLLAAWFLTAVIVAVVKALARRRERFSLFITSGCLAGIAAMLFHSTAEFNMQIGANALVFFFLLGLTVAAAHTREPKRKRKSYLAPAKLSPRRRKTLAGAAAATAAAALIFSGGILLAALQGDPVRAARLDPLEGRHHLERARERQLAGETEGAVDDLAAALRRAPTRGEYLQRLGLLHGRKGERELADRYFLAGVEFDRGSADRHRIAGGWFLSRGMKEEGLALMKAAIALDLKETEIFITQLVLAGVTDEEIGEAIPPAVGPLLHAARYFLDVERADLALEAYLAVVEIDPGNRAAQRALERMTIDDGP